MAWNELEVLGAVPMNAGTVLVKTVDLGPISGKRVDIRLFVAKADGTTTHTKQGLSFTTAQCKDAIKLLQAAIKSPSLKG